MTTEQAQQRYFSLLLAVKPGVDPYPGIRHILKLALRRYGLRCVEARELGQPVKHPRAVEEPAEPPL